MHSSDERLAQAARSMKTDGLEATTILKRRLQNWEGKTSHLNFKVDLASERRFGDRKSYSCSAEQEYKNKFNEIKD